MAEATTQITVTPKQLGKHLRSIRRKKGLSLAEVARGAGLSRRELVAYERGKVPIPESDLWVLAGSCGVDVAELMPSTSSMELTVAANATSIGDTISQLRRSQEDAGVTAYLPTLQKLQALPPGKRIPVKERELEQIATALGSTPRSIEQKLQEILHVSPDEAERLRAMILVPPNTKRPRALAAAPSALPAPAPTYSPVGASAVPELPAPATGEVTETAPPLAPVAEVAPEVAPQPVQAFPVAPPAFLDQPIDAPFDPVHGHNVDVFEELARLPEPVPLGDPSAPMPDLLAPPDPFAEPLVPAVGPPEGAVELVDTTMPSTNGAAAPAAWSAADAPPIDVAMRQGSATWDLGEPPLVARTTPESEPETWDIGSWQPPAPAGGEGTPAGFWEGTDDWTPPSEPPLDDPATPQDLAAPEPGAEPVELDASTWAGATWDPEPWPAADTATETSFETPFGVPIETPIETPVDVNPWAVDEWPREPAELGAWDHRPDPAAVDSGFYVDWGTPETEAPPGWDAFAADAASAPTPTPTPAPAPEDEVLEAPPAWETWTPAGATEIFETVETAETAEIFETAETVETDAGETVDGWFTTHEATGSDIADDDFRDVAPVDVIEVVQPGDGTPFVASADGTVELAPIRWRADEDASDEHTTDDDTTDADTTDVDTTDDDTTDVTTDDTAEAATRDADQHLEPVEPVDVLLHSVDGIRATEVDAAEWALDTDPTPRDTPRDTHRDDEFVTAGSDWQLGNALPLVEVQSQGGLVMRRADERWALADVTTASDFVAEVEVDFRSGPGFGVLFRASVDDDGRMSGYSFDIDPIYDGGGFLVRQWQADRELWNPIARVSGDDPTSVYGALLVRIEVVGEHLTARVNGVEVLTVENLKQASADRGRDAATGDRVGVQAWSSSDLAIDSVRVAAR